MSLPLRRDMDIDYSDLLVILLTKLAPGQEVVLTDADAAAAGALFSGEDVALRVLDPGDGTIHVKVVSLSEAQQMAALPDGADQDRPQ